MRLPRMLLTFVLTVVVGGLAIGGLAVALTLQQIGVDDIREACAQLVMTSPGSTSAAAATVTVANATSSTAVAGAVPRSRPRPSTRGSWGAGASGIIRRS